MTIIEQLIFALLFTIGFIPGHLIAEQHGMLWGILFGVGASIIFALLWRLTLAIVLPKIKTREASVKTEDSNKPV